jgi:hypothetical protein
MNPKLIIQNPTSAMLVGNYEAGWKESDVPALLGSLDEDFLPDVDLDHGNLNYTVVIGEVLGNYEAQKQIK